jgi:regulator of sirC expression with transglutaminase-like and TPR domain
MKVLLALVLALMLAPALAAEASRSVVAPAPYAQPLAIVRAVMQMPESEIDLARAKLIFDKISDPATDIAARVAEIDAMAQTVRAMASPSAPERLRLVTLRKFIYEAGPWNTGKPFQYDLSDPLGLKPENRLLSTYIRTHRGNCVSMPVLFVALAQRLGLNATLSTAPDHMFVKYTDDVTGKTVDLETTSGAYPARDAYIRQNMPMTDASIANGIYMKTLSKKEALVVLARGVIEHEMTVGHYQQAWDIAELLRPYYPNDLAVLLTPANAALGVVHEEYLSKYPHKENIPPELRGRLDMLEVSVSNALNHAYALGWRETDGHAPASPAVSAAVEPAPARLSQR